jgi:hypothetical protein
LGLEIAELKQTPLDFIFSMRDSGSEGPDTTPSVDDTAPSRSPFPSVDDTAPVEKSLSVDDPISNRKYETDSESDSNS